MKIPRILRRFWFSGLSGSRYYFDTPKPYILHRRKGKTHSITTVLLWLSALFVCRWKGHVIDGREMGGGCGQYKVDAWCSRCFFGKFQIAPDDAPWLKERHVNLVRAVKKAFEEGPPGMGEDKEV